MLSRCLLAVQLGLPVRIFSSAFSDSFTFTIVIYLFDRLLISLPDHFLSLSLSVLCFNQFGLLVTIGLTGERLISLKVWTWLRRIKWHVRGTLPLRLSSFTISISFSFYHSLLTSSCFVFSSHCFRMLSQLCHGKFCRWTSLEHELWRISRRLVH